MKTDTQIVDEIETILNKFMDQMYQDITEVSASFALGTVFGTVLQRGRS